MNKTPKQLLDQCNRIGDAIVKGRKYISESEAKRLQRVNNTYWALLEKIESKL